MNNIWNVLNEMIKRHNTNRNYPCYIYSENKTMSEKKLIANKFNKYFVHVGKMIENSIVPPNDTDGDSQRYHQDKYKFYGH